MVIHTIINEYDLLWGGQPAQEIDAAENLPADTGYICTDASALTGFTKLPDLREENNFQ